MHTQELEQVGATYEIARYGPGVLHSFTEWGSDSPPYGQYSPLADRRSWQALLGFLSELFDGGVAPAARPEPPLLGERVRYGKKSQKNWRKVSKSLYKKLSGQKRTKNIQNQ